MGEKQVVAKFQCESRTEGKHGDSIDMYAVYGPDGENADFTKATPSGNIKMSMEKDSEAAKFFKPGKFYYVTFTEASE